jgi:hypothetical protein
MDLYKNIALLNYDWYQSLTAVCFVESTINTEIIK